MSQTTAAKKRSSWMITVPLTAGAVAYLIWSFFPSMRALRELRAEIQTRRDFIAQHLESNVRHASGGTRSVTYPRILRRLARERAPMGKQFADFLGRVLSLANASGTSNTRLEPQPPVEGEALAQIPVRVSVTGSFAETFELLRKVEQLPQAIWISDVRIEGGRAEGSKAVAQVKLDVFTDNREISN